MQCNRCLPSFTFKDKRGWKLQKYSFFFKYQTTYKIHKSINSKFKILLSETFKTGLLREYEMLSHNDKVGKITWVSNGVCADRKTPRSVIGQDLFNYLKLFFLPPKFVSIIISFTYWCCRRWLVINIFQRCLPFVDVRRCGGSSFSLINC